MAKDKILVVGGYGHVGRTISTQLANHFPGRVIVAGRNYQKAEAFSQETEQTMLPLRLDISAPDAYDDLLKNVSIVVMCLDQADTSFIEACLCRGIHYVDITATYSFLSKVEALDAEAKKSYTSEFIFRAVFKSVSAPSSAWIKWSGPGLCNAGAYFVLYRSADYVVYFEYY